MGNQYQIAAYYFPNYHSDSRNAQIHGKGWTEWEIVKQATPRFAGHDQPKVPLWGYEDESDPVVMAKKISTAADYGVNVFLFDWYYYNDGPFLEGGLEKGFLGARNNQRIKFAIHWANHDWVDIHPAKLDEIKNQSSRLLYPGEFTWKTFEQVVDHVINMYFQHPAYWKINGSPYFSFYDLPLLVKSLGGVEGAREGLIYLRRKTQEAGFPGLHLNQVLWNMGILPGEATLRNPGDVLQKLGFDSFTSYVWIHHVAMGSFPVTDYTQVMDGYLAYWARVETEIALPYHPNVTMGWDSSPRTVQSDVFDNVGYPFTPIIGNNLPEQFKQALKAVKARLDQRQGDKIFTINAWNEWTESSYLEPDTTNGFGYLGAIRDIFGST